MPNGRGLRRIEDQMVCIHDVIDQIVGGWSGTERSGTPAVRVRCADCAAASQRTGERPAIIQVGGDRDKRSAMRGCRAGGGEVVCASVPTGEAKGKRAGQGRGEYCAV